MLTPTQRAALSSALEGADTGDGDATQALYRALSDVLPFHTLNILTAAQWLLRVDDAHTQAVRAAYDKTKAACKAVEADDESGEHGWDNDPRYYDGKAAAARDIMDTIAALRQEAPSE